MKNSTITINKHGYNFELQFDQKRTVFGRDIPKPIVRGNVTLYATFYNEDTDDVLRMWCDSSLLNVEWHPEQGRQFYDIILEKLVKKLVYKTFDEKIIHWNDKQEREDTIHHAMYYLMKSLEEELEMEKGV